MKNFPIALEVLSFLLPLRQRFIQSCHLRKSACTFKSCAAFGEEANSLQWLKNLLWSFNVGKLWISWHQHCNFHCSHDSSEKDVMSSAQPTGQKDKLILADMYLFLLFSLTICSSHVAKNRKDKKELLFHLCFSQNFRCFLALEQSGSREYVKSCVAAIYCRGKSMLPIKLTQLCVHTQIFCFQMLHFALGPFPVVIINLSSVFYQLVFQLDLHINRLRLIHFF